jgi:hypothetical protein
MDQYEHAQQIYSMWLAALATSGTPMPSVADAAGYAEMSWLYAEAFLEKNRMQGAKVI